MNVIVGTPVPPKEIRWRLGGPEIVGRPIPFKLPGRKGGTPQENVVVRAAIDAKLGRARRQRFAIALAFVADEVGMGRADDRVECVGMGGNDRRHRLDEEPMPLLRLQPRHDPKQWRG